MNHFRAGQADNMAEFSGRQVVERTILSGILLDGQPALDRVLPVVSASHFAEPGHRIIFDAMVEVGKTTVIDVVTVHIHLVKDGKSNDYGSLSYLNDICQFAPSSHNIELYALCLKLYSEQKTSDALQKKPLGQIVREVFYKEEPKAEAAADNIVPLFDTTRQRVNDLRDWFTKLANEPSGHLAAVCISITSTGTINISGIGIEPQHASTMLEHIEYVADRLEQIAAKGKPSQQDECKVISIFGGKNGAA